MEKSKLILSLLSMLFSLFVLIMVSFAWFTLSPTSAVQPLSLSVQSTGLVEYFEIHYYTVDNVYRRDSANQTIYVFDSAEQEWVLPVYEDPDEADFAFSGIIMNQYDPLIPVANLFNNIIVEIYLEFSEEEIGTALLSVLANPAFAAEAVAEFANDTPSYFSFFAYLQMYMPENPLSRNDGQNLYSPLTTQFTMRAGNDDLVYELVSFYDESDIYSSTLDFDAFTMQPEGVTLYFNFSYYEEKIIETFFAGGTGTTPSIQTSVLFFQDIGFLLRKGADTP